jgi:UDP-glucose:glycoprotein glucosyltransferase
MEYYNKVGHKTPQVILNGIPFNGNDIEPNAFEDNVVNKITKITPDLQMAFYNGQLYENHNIVDWLMTKDVIMPRLNPRILTPTKQFIEFNSFDADTEAFVNNIKYLKQSGGKDKLHSLSIWTVCDPDTEQGRALVADAVEFFESNVNTRLAMLFQSMGSETTLMKKAILYALENFENDVAIGFIKKITKEKVFDDLLQSKKSFDQIEVKVWKRFGSFDINLERFLFSFVCI